MMPLKIVTAALALSLALPAALPAGGTGAAGYCCGATYGVRSGWVWASDAWGRW